MMSTFTGIDAPFLLLDDPAPGELPDEFFALARRVYADDPTWIPEDEAAVRHRFSAADPWFDRGRAHIWCAPGRSRLAAFVAPGTTVAGVPSAFFGYWETRGPAAVDAELFNRAEAWARAQGARHLYGPIDFSTFGRYRLRTGGDATAAPFPQEPHNPPHYPAILAKLGFGPTARSYHSLMITPPLAARLAEAYRPHRRAVEALGFRLEPLDAARWLGNLLALHRLCDVVFGEQFAYSPLPFDEFAAACGPGYARRLAPDLSVVARDPAGAVVGFVVNSPDWSPLLAQGNPRRLRISEIDHDRHRALLADHRPATALIRTGGVVPEHRRIGLAYALLSWIFEQVAAGDWDRATVGVVTAGNAVDHLLRRYDPPIRTYALYGKRL